MNNGTRRFLSVLLALVFLCSTALLIRQNRHKQQAEEAQRKAEALAAEQALTEPTEPAEPAVPPTTETAPETTAPPQQTQWIPAPVEETDPNLETLQAIDLSVFQEENPDVIGWILIPDTVINYPLLQGEDNTYYLKHAWDGSKTIFGSIFLEQNNDPGMTDFNSIIYGHNMQSGSMFAGLHDFSDPAFTQAHPYVYLLTASGVFRYEIFATCEAEVDSSTYGLSFRQEQTKAAFLQAALENSEIDTGIVPALTDRFLTLSTCTGFGYGSRRVVQARLKMVETTLP